MCNEILLHLVAKAARSQRDMAEELSRQLEDILSTYCRETLSDDALPNGQSHSLEFNGMAGDSDKPGEGKATGANGGEREPRKSQEKKKVKGLGKKLFSFVGDKCHYQTGETGWIELLTQELQHSQQSI